MVRLPIAIVLATLLGLSACATDDGGRGDLDLAARALYGSVYGSDRSDVFAYSTRALERPDLEPEDRAKAYEIRGIAHLKKSERGNLREREAELALADLERAVELAPAMGVYYLMRGVAYYRTGQYDKAIADYDLLRKVDPRGTLGLVASRNRAAAFIAMGDADKAIAEYTSEISRTNLTLPGAYLGRCFALAASGKYSEALSDCERSLSWERWHGAVDARAYVYLKLEQYPQAIRDYDDVLRSAPNLVTSLYGRGMAKLGNGDSAGGKRDMDAALLLDPGVAGRMDKTRNWLPLWSMPSNPWRYIP